MNTNKFSTWDWVVYVCCFIFGLSGLINFLGDIIDGNGQFLGSGVVAGLFIYGIFRYTKKLKASKKATELSNE